MAKLQEQFIEFHDIIKLDDENRSLREKRDIILTKLRANMPGEARPFKEFNQGSYAMGTGIQPVDGDYDIDVGLRFDMSTDDADPVAAKKWVYDALHNHTQRVVMKSPCITVIYSLGREPSFHVDLAVYAANNSDEQLYLARGRLGSKEELRGWERSSPLFLCELIQNHFSDTEERQQFKRVIRYLKRWKDLHFSAKGNEKPTGIALTIAAWKYMSFHHDGFFFRGEPDDLAALIHLVDEMLRSFRGNRLELKIPIAPKGFSQNLDYNFLNIIPSGDDLLAQMTKRQMENFKTKLKELLEDLREARDEEDIEHACEILRVPFGFDFPSE